MIDGFVKCKCTSFRITKSLQAKKKPVCFDVEDKNVKLIFKRFCHIFDVSGPDCQFVIYVVSTKCRSIQFRQHAVRGKPEVSKDTKPSQLLAKRSKINILYQRN